MSPKLAKPTKKYKGAQSGNQNTRGKHKPGAGRPSKYSPAMIPIVCAMNLYGALDEEIAETLGVTERTLRSWRASKPEFSSGTA
jgi:hypothetical protein